MKVKVIKKVKKFAVPVVLPSEYPFFGKTITFFQDAGDLFNEYLTAEQLKTIPADILQFVRNFDAFDATAYYVVNNNGLETVITVDSINGMVIEENKPINKFIAETLQYASDEINNGRM